MRFTEGDRVLISTACSEYLGSVVRAYECCQSYRVKLDGLGEHTYHKRYVSTGHLLDRIVEATS